MYIDRPKSPEELYKLFVKGMPLKPIEEGFGCGIRRKGWNISIYRVDAYNRESIQIEFYAAISAYYPDWTLKAYKHVDTETKNT